MGPFRNYRQVIPGAARCRPFYRCAVCCRQAARLSQEFGTIVCGSWSPAEIDILRKAAHSALL